MCKRLTLDGIVLTTVLTIIPTVTFSTQALAQSSGAGYYVGHNFSGTLGGVPNLVGGRVAGYAEARPGGRPDAYNSVGIAFGNPLQVNVSGSAFSRGPFSYAYATSAARASINGNTIQGGTMAAGFASASPPLFGRSSAIARSSATLNAGQLGINPFGQFTWKPLFWDSVSGAAATSVRRVGDPIAYTITDPITQNVLRTGSLLDISASFDAGSIEWGVADNPSDPGDGSTPPPEDDKLDIAFTNNGSFTIDLTDSAVTDPGLFRVEAQGGTIIALEQTGRFAALTGLPSIGQSSTFSIPFSSIFPKEIPVDFAFNGLNGGNEIDVAYKIGGDGNTEVEAVPEPLTILGSLATIGFGAYAERKRKPSKSSKKDNTKTP